MARIARGRKQPTKVGNTLVKSGNASKLGGFKHFRVGHELAVPVRGNDGSTVYRTKNGRQFRIKKM
jgi:hypothetical protein